MTVGTWFKRDGFEWLPFIACLSCCSYLYDYMYNLIMCVLFVCSAFLSQFYYFLLYTHFGAHALLLSPHTRYVYENFAWRSSILSFVTPLYSISTTPSMIFLLLIFSLTFHSIFFSRSTHLLSPWRQDVSFFLFDCDTIQMCFSCFS